jgi:hypothetical protein
LNYSNSVLLFDPRACGIRHTLANMHDLEYRPVDVDAGLDEAPITAADELGAIGELTTSRPEPASHRKPTSHRAGRFMGHLGHVPEHEVPHPSLRWFGRAGALLVGVLAISTAFIASYVGALHEPAPHGVPVGVVRGDDTAQALVTSIGERGGGLGVRVYGSPAEARRALGDREVYAVLAFDPGIDALRLTVAGGAAPGVADLVIVTIKTASTGAVTVEDAYPAAPHDPRGLTPFYLTLGWILGGYLAATALAVILGTVPRTMRRLGMRLGAFAAFAALLSIAGALIVSRGYGIWSGPTLALWLAGTLAVFSAAVATAALESWIGLVGTGIAMLGLFVLGNPGAGGVYAPELLPAFFHDLHRWLPTGQATDLVRAVEYFGARATTWPVAGLASYAVAGLVLLLGATVALGHRHSRPPG